MSSSGQNRPATCVMKREERKSIQLIPREVVPLFRALVCPSTMSLYLRSTFFLNGKLKLLNMRLLSDHSVFIKFGFKFLDLSI